MLAHSEVVASRLSAARAALRTGEAANAIAALLYARTEEPQSAEVLELLGMAHWMAGNIQAARQELDEATHLDPRRASAHYNFALVLAELNMLDEAVQENHAALFISPGHEGALKLHANLTQRIKFRDY